MYKKILFGVFLLFTLICIYVFANIVSSKKSSEMSMKLEEKSSQQKMQKEISSDMKMNVQYMGTVLAGSSSPLLDFKKADYDKASSAGKIIVLDFYANWCPICRAEALHIKTGFDSLKREDVVGFRVNFNDSDTDQDEKDLAKNFQVPYQHTKVIIKNGKEVFRTSDSWEDTSLSSALANL